MGRHIYFNSMRTGTIAALAYEGRRSEQQQLTNDGYNNWFPHLSPDGKWIVFITFPKDISPERSSVLQTRPTCG
jgi:Tol biopolymer transport system component